MTKTISAKKKFKKCLRINTVLPCAGSAMAWDLWPLQTVYCFVFSLETKKKYGQAPKPIFHKHLNFNTLKISKSKKIGTKPF